METRQSPSRSANACSMCAVTSLHSCASPRFRNSMVTAIPLAILSKRHGAHLRCKPVKAATDEFPGCSSTGLSTVHVENHGNRRRRQKQVGQFRAPRRGKCDGANRSRPKNGKGCDIGYAPAASSCERANSVDACTVAAFDAITAFAVPNPNCSSQNQSVFSGPVALQVALRSRSLSLLRIDKVYFANPFSRRRGTN